jgi:MtN3 and saliva related transmembrane protein
MDLVGIVGPAASVVTVVSFIPQGIKAWKSKRVKDLSYGTLGLLLLSGVLWTCYGVLISDKPVIVTNVAVIAVNLAVLGAKIRYRNA